jgi:hypothetical protein
MGWVKGKDTYATLMCNTQGVYVRLFKGNLYKAVTGYTG